MPDKDTQLEKEFGAFLEKIEQRMSAMDKAPTEDQVKAWVREGLDDLKGDEEFIRRMRFGDNTTERELVGTKFARHNLGLAEVELLFDLQNALTGQKRATGDGVYKGPSDELKNTFEAISDAVYIPDEEIRKIDRKALDDLFPRIPLARFYGKDRVLAKKGAFELTEAYQRAIRAMDTAESGYGSQLVGAQYVGDLWEAARRESVIFSRIESFEMTAPTAYLPVEVDIPELLFVSESTANNSANYSTVKTGSQRVQVDAKKFVLHQMFSGEMEEDAILPFVPFLRRQAELGMRHYSDSLALNGDTTNAGTGNINLDDADPADTKHYLAFDGIRHVGLVDVTTNQTDMSGAAVALYDKLLKLRGKMIDSARFVDWGHPIDPTDLIYVADPESADLIALQDEVLTVDKYGAGATVLAGEQLKIGRHPLISSMAMSKTEADGKVSTTGGNNTLGQVAAFNRRGCVVGWRRRVKLEAERLIGSDQTRLVWSMRLGMGRFTPTGAASGIESAAVLFNLSLA